MSSSHTLELFRSRDLDHGYTGPNVDQKVWVDIRSGLGKFHRFGIGVAVREDFVWDLSYEEIKAYQELLVAVSVSAFPMKNPYQ